MRSVLTCSLLLSISVIAPAQARKPAVAMVTDATGEAHLGANPDRVGITQEVNPGERLTLKPGTKLALLLYGTGEEVHLSGPGTFTIDGKGAIAGPAAGVHRAKRAALKLKEPLKPGGLAQASLVMRGPLDIDMESPSQSVVRTPRPAFKWAPVPGATSYALTLRKVEGSVVFTATTQKTALDLPAGFALQPGVRYHWDLIASIPGPHTLQSSSDLELLDKVKQADLEVLQTRSKEGFTQHLLFASALQVFGLTSEAKVVWAELAAQRPEDPILKHFAR